MIEWSNIAQERTRRCEPGLEYGLKGLFGSRLEVEVRDELEAHGAVCPLLEVLEIKALAQRERNGLTEGRER